MDPLFMLKYIVAFLSFLILLYSLSLMLFLGANIKSFKNRDFIAIVLLLIGLLSIGQIEKITNVLYINITNVLVMGIILHIFSIISLVMIYFYVSKTKNVIDKILHMDPVDEEIERTDKRDYELEHGIMHLVLEKRPEKAYDMFVDQIKFGKKGVCITINPAKKIRDEYGLKKTPIIEIGADFTRYMRIEHLQHELIGFIKKTKGEGVILIDCVERLITNTHFNDVYHMLQILRDHVVKNDTILIVSLNRDTLDKKEFALIEKELEMV